jgi:hypothetical protein
MGFSAKQVKALRHNLDHRYVRTREANGRELSYIEGWYAISEANRIFGFDGWTRETVESRWPGCGFRFLPMARRLFGRATDRAKAVAPPLAKSTTPQLRLQKPMRLSER